MYFLTQFNKTRKTLFFVKISILFLCEVGHITNVCHFLFRNFDIENMCIINIFCPSWVMNLSIILKTIFWLIWICSSFDKCTVKSHLKTVCIPLAYLYIYQECLCRSVLVQNMLKRHIYINVLKMFTTWFDYWSETFSVCDYSCKKFHSWLVLI